MTTLLMPDHDYIALDRELDKTKSAVFMGKRAAFLGSLLCSLNFMWSGSLLTAATDGINLWWNPDFFLKIPKLARQTVLVHELWHPGRLHFVRMGSRDPKIWNYACDIRINNDLKAEGYSFVGLEGAWLDPNIPEGMPEEDIYDYLIQNNITPPPTSLWGSQPGGTNPNPNAPTLPGNGTDMVSPKSLTPDQLSRAVGNVVRAVHQAKLSGGAGSVPGDVEQILNKFFAPIVPWEQVLHAFMRDLQDEEYTWKRPNRRFGNMYLPSHYLDEGRLEELMFFEDVSGSITDEDAVRFNSEVKYVKDVFKPKCLKLVQFDTRITQEVTFNEEDPFDQIKIVGRGGTSLVPVREHIIKHRPTAAIIFSDLKCNPMEPLPFDLPVIWVAIRNREVTVPFGKLIHIR